MKKKLVLPLDRDRERVATNAIVYNVFLQNFYDIESLVVKVEPIDWSPSLKVFYPNPLTNRPSKLWDKISNCLILHKKQTNFFVLVVFKTTIAPFFCYTCSISLIKYIWKKLLHFHSFSFTNMCVHNWHCNCDFLFLTQINTLFHKSIIPCSTIISSLDKKQAKGIIP